MYVWEHFTRRFYNLLEDPLKEDNVTLEQALINMTAKQIIAFHQYLKNCGYKENLYYKDNIHVTQLNYHGEMEDQSADIERTLSYPLPTPIMFFLLKRE